LFFVRNVYQVDMSGDEILLMIGFVVFSALSWGKLYDTLVTLSPLVTGKLRRLEVALLLPLYLVALFYFPRNHADEYVRNDIVYWGFPRLASGGTGHTPGQSGHTCQPGRPQTRTAPFVWLPVSGRAGQQAAFRK